jgi:hypothetical protein
MRAMTTTNGISTMSSWRGNILSYDNAKTTKGEKYGWASFIFMGAPHTESGYNACAGSSAGCRPNCLYYAGRGAFPKVQAARIRKTKLYFEDFSTFKLSVEKDIKSALRWADKNNLAPCFRLDGTTDLGVAKHFVSNNKSIQFYDYTKCLSRIGMAAKHDNWHITYSLSENTTAKRMAILLASNSNIAVPFHDVPPPGGRLLGREIVSGDETDLRFLDGTKKIITLKVKGGKGKRSKTDFILRDGAALETRFLALA